MYKSLLTKKIFTGHVLFAAMTALIAFPVYYAGVKGLYFIVFFGMLFLIGIPILNFLYIRSDRVGIIGEEDTLSPEKIDSIFQVSSLDVIVNSTFERLRSLFDADSGMMVVYNIQSRFYEIYEQTARGRRVVKDAIIGSENPLMRALSEHNIVVLKKRLDSHIAYDARIIDVMNDFGMVIAAPIIYNDRFLGTLMLGGRTENFSDNEIDIIRSFASKIGVVYMNGFLWQEAVQRKDVEKEYELGRRTQNNFLPPLSGIMGGYEFVFSLPEQRGTARHYFDLYSEFGELMISVYTSFDVMSGSFVFLPSLIPLMQTYFRRNLLPEEIVRNAVAVSGERGISNEPPAVYSARLTNARASWAGSGIATLVYNTSTEEAFFGEKNCMGRAALDKNMLFIVLDEEVLNSEDGYKTLLSRLHLERKLHIKTMCDGIAKEFEKKLGRSFFIGILRRIR
jgi:hypothetical protein